MGRTKKTIGVCMKTEKPFWGGGETGGFSKKRTSMTDAIVLFMSRTTVKQ